MNNRIIVVDDDPSILELLSALLEAEGYQVSAFSSAPAALQAALVQPPDVAVIDLMMPEMDGRELIQALREGSMTRDVPILVCSAYYSDLRRCALELGQENIAFLRKPFRIETLLEMVGEMASSETVTTSIGQGHLDTALQSGGGAR